MREILKGKRAVYFLTGAVILLGCATWFFAAVSEAQKEAARLKSQYKEILLLKDEFLSRRSGVDAVEKKKELVKVNGVIPAVEDVFYSLGLKSRIKAIKPAGTREITGDVEEEAEVSAERITMNEMMNLFYAMENTPVLLVLKKADIKTSFEKPELLNITLVISLVHAK